MITPLSGIRSVTTPGKPARSLKRPRFQLQQHLPAAANHNPAFWGARTTRRATSYRTCNYIPHIHIFACLALDVGVCLIFRQPKSKCEIEQYMLGAVTVSATISVALTCPLRTRIRPGKGRSL
jgi:hypothetical protein